MQTHLSHRDAARSTPGEQPLNPVDASCATPGEQQSWPQPTGHPSWSAPDENSWEGDASFHTEDIPDTDGYYDPVGAYACTCLRVCEIRLRITCVHQCLECSCCISNVTLLIITRARNLPQDGAGYSYFEEQTNGLNAGPRF